MLVGYSTESKAYRVYDQIKKNIIITCDVVFDEGIKMNDIHTIQVPIKPSQSDELPDNQVDSGTIVVDTNPIDDMESDQDQDDASDDNDTQSTLRELSWAIGVRGYSLLAKSFTRSTELIP